MRNILEKKHQIRVGQGNVEFEINYIAECVQLYCYLTNVTTMADKGWVIKISGTQGNSYIFMAEK
jgi:hypothetical protein